MLLAIDPILAAQDPYDGALSTRSCSRIILICTCTSHAQEELIILYLAVGETAWPQDATQSTRPQGELPENPSPCPSSSKFYDRICGRRASIDEASEPLPGTGTASELGTGTRMIYDSPSFLLVLERRRTATICNVGREGPLACLGVGGPRRFSRCC